ncbi:unnamed protein product [Cuscuta epithymum]|uniref:Uncharacterized protein n=1 Tax=Cuscuta epithymum TaxID=186058 RepID=A0AAV0C972_9ASTE|nr:unnamed protein product [Cuscuta epithymum]
MLAASRSYTIRNKEGVDCYLYWRTGVVDVVIETDKIRRYGNVVPTAQQRKRSGAAAVVGCPRTNGEVAGGAVAEIAGGPVAKVTGGTVAKVTRGPAARPLRLENRLQPVMRSPDKLWRRSLLEDRRRRLYLVGEVFVVLGTEVSGGPAAEIDEDPAGGIGPAGGGCLTAAGGRGPATLGRGSG